MGNELAHAVSAGLQSLMLTVRERRVMLDSTLARIYGVAAMRLNEQVKRNLNRFPVYFAFQLAREQVAILKSQNAISTATRAVEQSRLGFLQSTAS